MAEINLVEVAENNDWMVDAGEPDYFGDYRVAAVSPAGEIMTLVFNDTGKMAGCYFRDHRGRNWHTERITVARQWLLDNSGPIDMN